MGYAVHSHSTHSRMSPIFSNDATYDHIRHFDVLNHGRGCQPLSDVAVTDGDGGHEAGDNQEAPQEPGQTWRRTLIGHFGGTSGQRLGRWKMSTSCLPFLPFWSVLLECSFQVAFTVFSYTLHSLYPGEVNVQVQFGLSSNGEVLASYALWKITEGVSTNRIMI